MIPVHKQPSIIFVILLFVAHQRFSHALHLPNWSFSALNIASRVCFKFTFLYKLRWRCTFFWNVTLETLSFGKHKRIQSFKYVTDWSVFQNWRRAMIVFIVLFYIIVVTLKERDRVTRIKLHADKRIEYVDHSFTMDVVWLEMDWHADWEVFDRETWTMFPVQQGNKRELTFPAFLDSRYLWFVWHSSRSSCVSRFSWRFFRHSFRS